MQADIALWKSRDGLTKDERRVHQAQPSDSSPAGESLVAQQYRAGYLRHLTNPSAASICCGNASKRAVHTLHFNISLKA